MNSSLIASLENHLDGVLNKFVTGSNLVKVADLIEDSSPKLSFKWSKNFSSIPDHNDIFKELIPQINGNINRQIKKIILADPGVGKSTISYLVYNQLFQDYKEGLHNICPIYIDLMDYRDITDFGTEIWTQKYLQSLGGKSNMEWIKLVDVYDSYKAVPFYILDSLDEYLADCTLGQIQSELNKFIFKQANLIGCRSQFYEYYISSSNKTFVKNYETLTLQSWDQLYEMKYAKWYFEKYFQLDSSLVENFLSKRFESPDLVELCRVPLRLNMILEILATNNMNFDLVKTKVSVYHNFTITTIKHESSRVGSTLPINDKIHLLKYIAWTFYDERRIGDDFDKNKFSVEGMKEALLELSGEVTTQTVDYLTKELIRSTVLVEDANDEFSISYSSVKFSHKSIQEFFVAMYIYEKILSKKSIVELGLIYRNFISQDIDIFLKDYFENINKDSKLLEVASANLMIAFNENWPTNSDENETLLRKQIARSQLGYALGHLNSLKVREFLDNILQIETNEYIKRSIIIGISIGGNSAGLNSYVDSLREDFESMSNKVNIGFQLSYFGDQAFDVLQPYIDKGLSKCKNSVQRLIQAMLLPSNQGALRIDLYSLLYLANHRPNSKSDFLISLRNNLKNYEALVQYLSSHEIYRLWPETEEAIDLLNKIKN